MITKKNCGDIPKIIKDNSTIVLTVIHTFGAVIEQLSLAFEITCIVKCSPAGPSNKSVNIFNAVVLGNGNIFTLWNRIIYTYI